MPLILDQSYETGQDNADASGIGNLRRASNNNIILGESFTPSMAFPTTRIAVYLKKVGSPTGNIWLEIRSDAVDPTVATQQGSDSNFLDVSTISTSYDYVAFDFAEIDLPVETEFWWLLHGDYALAADVGIYVGIDTSSPGYARGVYGRFGNGGAAWEDSNTYDILFKHYVSSPVSPFPSHFNP